MTTRQCQDVMVFRLAGTTDGKTWTSDHGRFGMELINSPPTLRRQQQVAQLVPESARNDCEFVSQSIKCEVGCRRPFVRLQPKQQAQMPSAFVSLMPPGQDFGSGCGPLFGTFASQGRTKCHMLPSASDTRDVRDCRRAPANDEIPTGFDCGKQRGQVRLGLSDLHVTGHVCVLHIRPRSDRNGIDHAYPWLRPICWAGSPAWSSAWSTHRALTERPGTRRKRPGETGRPIRPRSPHFIDWECRGQPHIADAFPERPSDRIHREDPLISTTSGAEWIASRGAGNRTWRPDRWNGPPAGVRNAGAERSRAVLLGTRDSGPAVRVPRSVDTEKPSRSRIGLAPSPAAWSSRRSPPAIAPSPDTTAPARCRKELQAVRYDRARCDNAPASNGPDLKSPP